MYEFLLFLFLVVAIALVGLILIQHGKGADMGASFGAGASGTVFGAPGAGNFLTKSTSFLALAFFAIALTLAYMTTNREEAKDGFWEGEVPAEEAVPAVKEATDIPAVEGDKSDIPAADIPKADDKTSDIPTVDAAEAEKKSENDESTVEEEDKNDDNSGGQ